MTAAPDLSAGLCLSNRADLPATAWDEDADPGQAQKAAAACMRCPVLHACRTWARDSMPRRDAFRGVIGGMIRESREGQGEGEGEGEGEGRGKDEAPDISEAAKVTAAAGQRKGNGKARPGRDPGGAAVTPCGGRGHPVTGQTAACPDCIPLPAASSPAVTAAGDSPRQRWAAGRARAAAELLADPLRSNREIGVAARADHVMVMNVRHELERAARIPVWRHVKAPGPGHAAAPAPVPMPGAAVAAAVAPLCTSVASVS